MGICVCACMRHTDRQMTFHLLTDLLDAPLYGPRREKTCLRGFRKNKTQI